jgi:hypothetical protein
MTKKARAICSRARLGAGLVESIILLNLQQERENREIQNGILKLCAILSESRCCGQYFVVTYLLGRVYPEQGSCDHNSVSDGSETEP